jgi:RimJ/RimL family protein N-acetyltransferase
MGRRLMNFIIGRYGRDASALAPFDTLAGKEVCEWVGERVGITNFGLCTTLGIADESGLIAGVVFNNYREPATIEATIASTSPRWCSRGTLGVIFGYVFDQLGCRRLTAVTGSKNQPVRAFLCRLGFREEGLLRHGFKEDDAVVFGMIRDECRWRGTKRRGHV